VTEDHHLSPQETDDYIHGRLPPDEDDAAIDHLSKCSECYIIMIEAQIDEKGRIKP
jgi:hypothetical protein